MPSLLARRGLFLSILIPAFGVSIFLATLLLIFDPGLLASLGSLPAWFNAFLVVFLLVRLAALLGIWYVRRLAVFSLLALEIVELCMGLFVFTSVLTFPQRLLIGGLMFVVLSLVWLIPLRLRWHSFA